MEETNKITEQIARYVAAAGSAALLTVSATQPLNEALNRIHQPVETITPVNNYRHLGMIGTLKNVYSQEGMAAMWKGVPTGWLRAATNTSFAIGLYEPIKIAMGESRTEFDFFTRFMAGAAAGTVGGFIGAPFDKIGMIMEKQLTSSKMPSKELPKGLVSQIGASVTMGMVLNGFRMSFYDLFSKLIRDNDILPEGLQTQVSAGLASGAVTSFMVAPIDTVRVQLTAVNGPLCPYEGFYDCMMKIVQRESMLGLFPHTGPRLMRFIPVTCMQLVLYELCKPKFGIEGGASFLFKK